MQDNNNEQTQPHALGLTVYDLPDPVQVAQQGAGADMQLIMLIRWPEHNLQASQLHTALSIFAQCRREWLGLAA